MLCPGPRILTPDIGKPIKALGIGPYGGNAFLAQNQIYIYIYIYIYI